MSDDGIRKCEKDAPGGKCAREAGHEGPCAAARLPWWQRLLSGVGNAIGEAKFDD